VSGGARERAVTRRALLGVRSIVAVVPLVMTVVAVVAGCERTPAASPLADTRWRLVEFQSMDDAIGTIRPDDSSDYTMQLKADGQAVIKLVCNYAAATWTSEPSADGTSGSFELGRLALTLAPCPSEMGDRIQAQAPYIRTYLLEDGRLYLSLMADGGILVWEPDEGEPTDGDVSRRPEPR